MKNSRIWSLLFVLLLLVTISSAQTTTAGSSAEATASDDSPTSTATATATGTTEESADVGTTDESASAEGTTEITGESEESPEWTDEEVVQTFLDADGDGQVTAEEIVAACAEYETLAAVFGDDCPTTVAEAEELIASYDEDGDGQLDAEELASATDDTALKMGNAATMRSFSLIVLSSVIALCGWM